jgi:hypothetical protein
MNNKPHTMQGASWPSPGHCSNSWEDILSFFMHRVEANDAFLPLLQLTQAIVSSSYPAAGLFGSTSMHRLLLGRSEDVWGNPHLFIIYDFSEKRFTFIYQDFTRELWTRTCIPEEAWPVLERFLLRRARWFKKVEVEQR